MITSIRRIGTIKKIYKTSYIGIRNRTSAPNGSLVNNYKGQHFNDHMIISNHNFNMMFKVIDKKNYNYHDLLLSRALAHHRLHNISYIKKIIETFDKSASVSFFDKDNPNKKDIFTYLYTDYFYGLENINKITKEDYERIYESVIYDEKCRINLVKKIDAIYEENLKLRW